MDTKVSGRLGKDLKTIFESPGVVPPEVDMSVMHRYSQYVLRHRPRALLRWAVSVAGAAAVIAISVTLALLTESQPALAPGVSVSARADIDGNGRVNILDAFQMARRLQSGEEPEKDWDVNADGVIDRRDVDSVAMTAVRLDRGVL